MTNMFFGAWWQRACFDVTGHIPWIESCSRVIAVVRGPSVVLFVHLCTLLFTVWLMDLCVCACVWACVCMCGCKYWHAYAHVSQYRVCICVYVQPGEWKGPQQQTKTHTMADLSEVIVSNSKQTTGHYHAHTASVQMWVLMEVHGVLNTINSFKTASRT